MFKWLFFCILFALSVLLGLSMSLTSGKMGIYFAGWTVETPIWFAVIALILVCALLIGISRFIKMFFHFGHWLRIRHANAKLQKAKNQTNQGLIAWLAGGYLKAEEYFIAGAKESNLPLINYVFAAQTASLLGEIEKADNYLKLAEDCIKEEKEKKELKVAIAIYEAEIYLTHNHFQQVIDKLQVLEEDASAHPKIYQLFIKAYLALKQWENLLRLLPDCLRSKALTESEVHVLQKQGYGELLLRARGLSLAAVQTAWDVVPKFIRIDPELIYVYTEALYHYQEYRRAEKIISQMLKKQWDDKLVLLYGKVKSDNSAAQLALAEAWLEQHSQDAVLLLTLGRLCLENQLWGKAQRYLEASHFISPCADTFLELGNLSERFNKTEESADYFKQGLCFYIKNNSNKA